MKSSWCRRIRGHGLVRPREHYGIGRGQIAVEDHAGNMLVCVILLE